MASREFVAAFEAVAKHYKCPPDEVSEMKDLARNDMSNASRSYLAMMEEIREEERLEK